MRKRIGNRGREAGKRKEEQEERKRNRKGIEPEEENIENGK